MVDLKLQQLRKGIHQGQEEVKTKAVKQAHYEKQYTFRKRVNKEHAYLMPEWRRPFRRPRVICPPSQPPHDFIDHPES